MTYDEDGNEVSQGTSLLDSNLSRDVDCYLAASWSMDTSVKADCSIHTRCSWLDTIRTMVLGYLSLQMLHTGYDWVQLLSHLRVYACPVLAAGSLCCGRQYWRAIFVLPCNCGDQYGNGDVVFKFGADTQHWPAKQLPYQASWLHTATLDEFWGLLVY